MSHTIRFILGASGLASWGAGGVATLRSDAGTGAAALIAAGLLALVLAFVGRWPTRLSVSGNQIVWEVRQQVDNTVQEQLVAAQSNGEREAVDELRELRHRLNTFWDTGRTPPHPAARYDEAVESALHQAVPGAGIYRESSYDRGRSDFVVRLDDREVLVETKWRRSPADSFRGSTLAQLTNQLRPQDRLLVVTNAEDLSQVARRLQDLLPGRAEVFTWSNQRDTPGLRDALTRLLHDPHANSISPP